VQALYRKWRPRTFEEVVGQDHVIRTLRNELRSGRIHHAYLFAGPRGTGKTTTARLLAKAVNCLASEAERPCNQCSVCLAVNDGRLMDLVEIDAASNTSVDDVRNLRERVGFRPTEARYRVYVIDEVHMLSNSAFNALLKTLEEPPPHVLFVLATTRPDKIPATVISRCQRFDFRRVPQDDVVGRLEWIASQESIKIDTEVLSFIARQSTGCLRDAESLLDQLASFGSERVTLSMAQEVLGMGSAERIARLVGAIASNDIAEGLDVINEAIEDGADPRQFARQVVECLRALLLVRLRSGVELPPIPDEVLARLKSDVNKFPTTRDVSRAVRVFARAGAESKGGWLPQLPLELALLEACASGVQTSDSGQCQSTGRGASSAGVESGPSVQPVPSSKVPADPNHAQLSEPAVAEGSGQGKYIVGHSQPKSTASPQPGGPSAEPEEQIPCSPAGESLLTAEALLERWPDVLEALRPVNLSLEALMRSCRLVEVHDDVLVISFAHSFHLSRVEEESNRTIVEDVLAELTGRRRRVKCVMDHCGIEESRPLHAPVEESTPEAGGQRSGELDTEDDPVVRTAVEQMGAQVLRRSE
jgi:DNA polymerase-3 subunit gamma/tau